MKKLLALCVGVLILTGGFAASGISQTENPNPIAQFLEVSPPKYDINIQPGQSVTQQVTLRNRHVSSIRLKTSFNNILADGDNGDVKPAFEPTPYDLARYAQVENSEFTLPPQQTRVVTVTLTVPRDVAPGGYYGMVRFTPTVRSDLPPVAIQGQIAALFLVRVPGPTTEKGTIKSFDVTNADGRKVGGVFIGNDLYWKTIVRNEGKVHFATAANVTAKDKFGGERYKNSTDARNVFPDGERRFEQRWENAKTGLYTTTVKAPLPGDTNAQKTLRVLVITPVFAMITAGVVALLVLILLTWLIRRRRRRRDVAL